ncbi:MAG: hypothetical protein EBU96_01265 [Actinobacteria bacterium]|nr:hypothetical protein [Actinomycetota bacterium]
MHDPVTDELKFLTWATDVDVVTPSDSVDEEQRFYYTGDGVPKVSTYALATATGEPYPNNFYELGLPLPETKLTTVATSFTSTTTASYARDAGNTATLITGSAHGLKTGNIVTVSGLPAATSSVATFNVTNAEVTVVNDTTFTYYSPGEIVSTTVSTAGKVSLAGNTVPRSYVYTWYTPWKEESIASEPSANLYIKEGQTVTVSNLPTAKPTGDNFIAGVKLYRTLASSSGTEYYNLGTLWFPIKLAKVKRLTNVVTVTTAAHHNLAIDDRVKISGCTDSTFNVTNGVVLDVIDHLTFTFAQVASDVAEKVETGGTLYHDVAETVDKTARYWGDGSYSFTDDFDYRNLTNILVTDEYDAPPADLQGLTSVQNNILIGFVGNTLYFSEPGKPWAWPVKYALTFPYNIVGVASVGGYILVLTTNYPYQVSGNNPATMAFARIDTLYPCVSKRSIVNMGYGVAYATYGGIAVYSPSVGMDLITKFVHDWDTWDGTLDPDTLAGKFYNGKYFGSHSTNSFMFEREDRIGGFFVSINYTWNAAWYDSKTNNFYYIADNLGNLYQWDAATQALGSMEWKSKVIVTKDYLNIGAARVIADYATPDAEAEAIAAYNAGVPAYNAQVWTDYSTPTQTASFARAANVATIVTATAHGLVTGSRVDVSGFVGGTASSFNAQQVVITVVNSTTFTYASVGSTVTTTSDTTGTVICLKGLGTLGGPFDRTTSLGVRIENSGTFNSTMFNGDNLTRTKKTAVGVLPITFRIWANKSLIFQGTVSDSNIFRLPTGYRSDTFEVAVSGSARVRAVHIGETPYGLRTA